MDQFSEQRLSELKEGANKEYTETAKILLEIRSANENLARMTEEFFAHAKLFSKIVRDIENEIIKVKGF